MARNPIAEWTLYKLLRARIWLGLHRYRREGPRAVRLDRRTLIKFGKVDLAEAEAMKFVAKNTSIPVPKVYKAFKLRGTTYIEMEYVEGNVAEDVWHFLSDEVKAQIVDDLKGYIRQLRALSPPDPDAVSSVLGGPVRDHRIGGVVGCGPFTSHEDFHRFLRLNWRLESCTGDLQPLQTAHVLQHKSKFTHGDLVPRNVIIRDGHVAAVIDWDCAGWYPEYWEYTKAHFAAFAEDDWMEALGRITGIYERELKAERVLWDRFDEPSAYPWPRPPREPGN